MKENELLERIYANHVVIYKLLHEIHSKEVKGVNSKGGSLNSAKDKLDKEADKVIATKN